MGIQGLLPMLKEVQTPMHIKEWKGKKVAIDAYVWLHRGVYGCAEDIALGKQTVQYVNYSMHRIRMLKYHQVTPIVVFDGGLLPSKMGTEDDRERRRSDARARGNALMAEGKRTQARECFVKAVDVTPEMAFQLIKALRREGVEYVVAPYEADPQLAYLEQQGIVDGIVTEDSDLLVFGCRNVLFKLDSEGNCVHLSRDRFAECREYNFAGWTSDEFRQMAILSGCDYLESIVGVGLKTAYTLMRKYQTAERVIKFLRMAGKHTVPRDYADRFRQAELTFRHQLVFDTIAKVLVPLTPLPAGLSRDDIPYAGSLMDEEFARGLALGDIDPISRLPMVDINPSAFSQDAAKPYQPSQFKPTKGKTSPKTTNSSQIATGKSSILNFFSKLPSTPDSRNPVASTSKLAGSKTPLSASGKKRTPDGQVKGGNLKSKFFGGSASANEKGKEVEVVVDEPEEITIVSDEDDEFPDDDPSVYEEAEAEDVGYDEDADAAMREIDVDMDVEIDVDVPEDEVRAREHSVASSLMGISSPAATPSPRIKRRKLEDVEERTRLEDVEEGESEVEDEGVSSPPVGMKVRQVVKEEEEEKIVVKKEVVEVQQVRRRMPSSDPIELSSGEEDDVATPKPAAKTAKGKGWTSAPSTSGNDSSFATPISSAAARKSLPTPSTSGPDSATRPTRPLPTTNRKPPSFPKLKPISTSSTPSLTRTPLSPKKGSSNILPIPREYYAKDIDAEDPEELVPSSSQQNVVITNSKLLAFRYTGLS
ncbi:exonuclease 1 [Pseudohyphozyma bogoriensis]|nr:exonuclease 1 [Pseudohyphozyma bogoriensis]